MNLDEDGSAGINAVTQAEVVDMEIESIRANLIRYSISRLWPWLSFALYIKVSAKPSHRKPSCSWPSCQLKGEMSNDYLHEHEI